MKRILMSGLGMLALIAAQPASAADRPIYKAPPLVTPIFSWNGCYIGAHIGGGWGTSDLGPTTPLAIIGSADTNGWFGGGQIGCNWHTSPNLVLGVEGDISWSDIKGNGTFVGFPGASWQSKLNYFGTVRGRIGFAMDRALLYGTAGFAWGNHTANAFAGGGILAATLTQDHTGWAAGAGLEYAFAQNWSAKFEYLYLDLGSEVYSAFGLTGPIDVKLHTLKVGLNYRF